MPWLRLDDRFTKHPKILKLKRVDRWTWLEILEYCAAYQTHGRVPKAITEVLPHATPALLEQCAQAGLLDNDTDGYHVHDWSDYNPKDPGHAERQRRYRQRQRDGNSDVTSDGESDTDSDASCDENRDGERYSPRVGGRARPVPSRPTTRPSSSKDSRAAIRQALDDDDLETAINRLGLNRDQTAVALEALTSEPDRVRAAIEAGLANGAKLAPYVDEILRNGSWPERSAPPSPRSVRSGLTCPECGIVVMAPTTLADHLWNAHEMEPPVGDTSPEPVVGEVPA